MMKRMELLVLLVILGVTAFMVFAFIVIVAAVRNGAIADEEYERAMAEWRAQHPLIDEDDTKPWGDQ